MSTPRRGMQRAAVRGRARAAHQGRAAQHGHARIWSWRVWYLHICNTGEVRSLQPMPVPRGVRFATYNRCPNKHKASCEIRSAPRSRVHTCNAALSDASPSCWTSRNHYGWHISLKRKFTQISRHLFETHKIRLVTVKVVVAVRQHAKQTNKKLAHTAYVPEARKTKTCGGGQVVLT